MLNIYQSDEDYPRFYASGDAFVLPSRGEGWGRPHVEVGACSGNEGNRGPVYLPRMLSYLAPAIAMVPTSHQAMSMALPVLATNWSGTTEFLDSTVGKPTCRPLVPAARSALATRMD